MKLVMNWIVDPYVHIILVALVLAHLAFGDSSAQNPERPSSRRACGICLGNIDPELGCLHPIAQTVSVSD